MKRKYSTVIFFICIFLIQLLFFVTVFPNRGNLPFVLLGIFLIIACVQLYLLIMQTLDDTRTDMELSTLQKQQELRKEQMEMLEERKKETEAIQQKMSENLKTFQDYLENGDYETAKTFLNEITDQFQKERFRPCCQDNLLNAILEGKRKIAAKNNIDVNYEILLPEECQIAQADLSSVFFNLLDNGIEACTKSGSENPILSLSANVTTGFLSIHMRNSKDPTTVFNHKTTKDDVSAHGFGLSIIEEICSRYDGVYQWEDQGDTFDSVVLLRMPA